MEEPESLPPDMQYDCIEEIASTSNIHVPALTKAVNTQTKVTKQNERKRQRIEGVLSPVNVDISDLKERIKNFIPQDQNKYGILGALADIDIVPPPVSNPTPTKAKDVNHKPKISWCPPIFVFNVNIKTLGDTLRSSLPDSSFRIINVNKSKSKIYLNDPKLHTSMMAILKDKNVQSYSFTPKELKQTSLVLRGLYHYASPEEVKQELDILIPNTVDKVSKYKTPWSVKNNKDTGLMLVSLHPGKKFGEVTHIREIFSQTIYWEKPKKKSGDLQCFRCQRWGHVSRNCNSAYNCVKCNQTHLPGECQRTSSDTTEPFCINCGKHGHPANFKGCPFYKKYILARKSKITKALEDKETAQRNVSKILNTAKFSPGKSFASMFRTDQNSAQASNQKPQIIEQFLELATFFMEPEELSLEQEIQLFLSNYKKMSKDEAKKQFMQLLSKGSTNRLVKQGSLEARKLL
ncbi:uncharacterized protein [Musca autumnalis]|uniref:uncharacterized protein n=1 Tax=Musca autumnalis TaxID=221902 RepID=UPI003CF00C46